jgi:hypothetical protein
MMEARRGGASLKAWKPAEFPLAACGAGGCNGGSPLAKLGEGRRLKAA